MIAGPALLAALASALASPAKAPDAAPEAPPAAAALADAHRSTAGDAPGRADPPPGKRAAAPLAVVVRAERTEARLGEPFTYEIDVRHHPEERYTLAGDLDAPPFRARARGCTRTEAGGEARTTCALSLALFALGPHDVPAVKLAVETPAGGAALVVPGPRITGVGIIDPAAPPERLSLRDPAPPVPLLVRSLRLLFWAGGLVALLAAALLARRAWRSRRARLVAAAEAPPPEPPSLRLRRRLDALEAKGLPARGLGREHVFELSEIVREWIGAVTGLNALDLTTAELVERLARTGDPRIDVEAMRRFAEEADLVKFARAPADAAACAAATRFARGLAP
jgi:hypothetical protein